MSPSGLKAAGTKNWLHTLEVSFILRQYVILAYESHINIFFFGETYICIRPSEKLKESGQRSVICLLNKRCGFWQTQIAQQNTLSRKQRHRSATAAPPQRHRIATAALLQHHRSATAAYLSATAAPQTTVENVEVDAGKIKFYFFGSKYLLTK